MRRYTGLGVLLPFLTHMPGKMGDDGKQAQLDAFEKTLSEIETTP